jgi:putative endonuclease
MAQKRPCVYILASRRNGTLYIGVTSDLALRIWQHRLNAVAGFVQDYGVLRLVFVEFHNTMEAAILREKGLKKVAASVEARIDPASQSAMAGSLR